MGLIEWSIMRKYPTIGTNLHSKRHRTHQPAAGRVETEPCRRGNAPPHTPTRAPQNAGCTSRMLWTGSAQQTCSPGPQCGACLEGTG